MGAGVPLGNRVRPRTVRPFTRPERTDERQAGVPAQG